MKKKKKESKKQGKTQNGIKTGQPAVPEFAKDGFFDLVPDLLCIASPDGYFKKLNASWERTLGFSRQELLASPYVVFIHPDDIERTFQEIEKQAAGYETINFGNRYRCKDGSYKWLQWRSKVTSDGKEIHAVAREITDLKIAADKVREEEERYKDIFENSPLGLFTLDINANVIRVNRKWNEIFGFSNEDVGGKWFGDILMQESINEFRDQYSRFISNGKIHSQLELIRKDGTKASIVLDGIAVYKKTGSFQFAHCLLQDVTADRKNHSLLLKSEEKIRAIIESTDDAVVVLDQTGNSVYTNSKFIAMWGIPSERLGFGEEENLLGYVVNRLQELKRIHLKVRELFQSTLSVSDVIEFKDGKIFEIRSHPWVMENQILGRVVYLRDKTGKIRMEKEMQESEERFRFLAEYSPNLIFISANGRILYVNKQCETITGYTQEEFCGPGFDFLKLTAPEYQALVQEKLRMVLSGEPVDTFEYVLINKAGRRICNLFSTKLIHFGGETALIGILTDITDRKRAEKIARQKVESLESYHNLMVGRELKMIELKKEVNKLLLLLGEKEKYKITG
jgi:PAS domain S-box-containing protein